MDSAKRGTNVTAVIVVALMSLLSFSSSAIAGVDYNDKCQRYSELSEDALKKGHFQDAIDNALRCMDIEYKECGDTSRYYIGSCLYLAELMGHVDNYEEIKRYCNEGCRAIEKRGDITIPEHYMLKLTMVEAALKANRLDDIKIDIELLDPLSIGEIINGNYFPLAQNKVLKAKYALAKGEDKSKVCEMLVEAYHQLEDYYKPDHDVRVGVIANMRECIYTLRNIGNIEACISLAESTLQKLPDMLPPDKADLLYILADHQNDPDSGLNYLYEAERLLQDYQNEDAYYSIQVGIAYRLREKNEVRQAIERYNSVCNHYKQNGVWTAVYHGALNDLADLYNSTGDFAKALECYRTSIDMYSDFPESTEYILSYIKWATLFCTAVKMNAVEATDHDGFEIGRNLRAIVNHRSIQSLLYSGASPRTIAEIFRSLFATIINIPAFTVIPVNAVENVMQYILDDILIPNNYADDWSALNVRGLIAHCKYMQGNNYAAIAELKTVIEDCKRLGCRYDAYVHDMAYMQFQNREYEDALKSFETGFNYNRDAILHYYKWMTAAEKAVLIDQRIGNLMINPEFAAQQPDNHGYAKLAYNTLLFSKGILLNSSIELTRLLQEQGDTETIRLLNEWRELSDRASQLENDFDPSAADFKAKAEELEQKLVEKSKTFGDYTKGLVVDCEDVRSHLSDNDIAVEFFSYWKSYDNREYGALVLGKNFGPVYVPVATQRDWAHIDLRSDCYNSSELFEILLGKLKNYFPAKQQGHIYFAADGILHTIAIESLPGAEKYDLRRLTSTRELTSKKDSGSEIQNIAVFGGIKYALGKTEKYCQAFASGEEDDDAQDTRYGDGYLKFLNGSVTEVKQIADILSPRLKVNTYSGKNATKSEFKNLSGGKVGILHVATHGFFDEEQSDMSSNPMERTGLYFAGAQNTIYNMDTKSLTDNGILTSQEISLLDFRGLKLAVLSACDTGKGVVTNEGVFGLQRALKQAGAEAILMSLWKVNDLATQILMTEFYRSLAAGVDPHEALRTAQAEVRKQYPDPRYWAAFILLDSNNLKL